MQMFHLCMEALFTLACVGRTVICGVEDGVHEFTVWKKKSLGDLQRRPMNAVKEYLIIIRVCDKGTQDEARLKYHKMRLGFSLQIFLKKCKQKKRRNI